MMVVGEFSPQRMRRGRRLPQCPDCGADVYWLDDGTDVAGCSQCLVQYTTRPSVAKGVAMLTGKVT